MKGMWCVWMSLFLFSFSCLAQESLALKPGEQAQFSQDNKIIIRAALGDQNVASLKVLNKSTLLVTGATVGETTLLVWFQGEEEPVRQAIQVNPQFVSTTNIQVQTDIKIVEISKTALKEAGFSFGKNHNNKLIGIGNSSALSGVARRGDGFDIFSNSGFMPFSDAFNVVVGDASRGILATLSALDSNGFAYTLAEPSLVTMSGHTATFLAGGEFPYPKSSNDGDISIEFKEFGVRLNLAPTVLDNGRIMLKVAPEVSELDYNQGVNTSGITVPGVSVRRTDTTVQLGDGESFVISGLISSSTIKNSSQFPGLGSIPIIGAFFSSKRLQQDDKELMMVVTPHLVKPIAKNATLPPLPGDIYRHYRPNFFKFIFLNQEPEKLPQDIGFSDGM